MLANINSRLTQKPFQTHKNLKKIRPAVGQISLAQTLCMAFILEAGQPAAFWHDVAKCLRI